MSTQQQRKQAPKTTTFLAGLLGSIDKDRNASNSPGSSASTPAAAQMASQVTTPSSRSPEISPGGARAATTVSPTNGDYPYTPLTRAASTPSHDHHGNTRHPYPSTSLDYGPSPGDRAVAQPRVTASLTRPYRPASDFYRPGSGSRSPRDNNRRRIVGSGRAGASYRPGYADRTTPPIRDCPVYQVVSPSVAQKNIAATLPSGAIGASGAQSQQAATPTPQPGPLRPVDDIIADLLKPHPKLAAQTHTEADKTMEPQRRKADVYRPSQRTRRQPNRLHHRQRYLSWSDGQLFREVNLRRLKSESKDRTYLVDILMVNDSRFFKMWEEFRILNVYELLEEAGLWHVDVDFAKCWNQQDLLTEIVEKMAQYAVSQHNDLLRAEQIPPRLTQVQTMGTAKFPSMDHGRSKVTKRSHKVKDRAVLKKTAEAAAEKAYEDAAANQSRDTSTKKPVSQTQSKKIKDIAAKNTKAKGIAKECHKNLEEGGKCHKPTSPAITYAMTNEGEDKGGSDMASSKKKLDKRRDSKQDSLDSSTAGQLNNAPAIKNRSLSIEIDEDSEDKPSSPPQPTQLGKATDAANDPSPENGNDDVDEMDIDANSSPSELHVVTDHETKGQATPDRKKLVATGTARSKKKALNISPATKNVAAAVSKTSHKRRSGASDDDEDSDSSEEVSLMEFRQTKKRKSSQPCPEVETDTGKQKGKATMKLKRKGIPEPERVPGIAYTKLSDGSWKIAQRIQKAGKVTKAKAEPSKNYIKG